MSVAVVNDYDLIVDGAARLLGHDPRLDVRDRIIIGEPMSTAVDIVLLDTFGHPGDIGDVIALLNANDKVGRVVVFSIDLSPDAVDHVLAAGAAGYISKSASAKEIADGIVAVAKGEQVTRPAAGLTPIEPELDWPGHSDGLSLRESEVVLLAADGLTNAEIGAVLYIGSETVKSHLRTAFAKLEVRNRVEATAYVHRSESFRSATLRNEPRPRRRTR